MGDAPILYIQGIWRKPNPYFIAIFHNKCLVLCAFSGTKTGFLKISHQTNMKALIPVAGAGTHLRPHTYTQPKPLIPVAGKPIISYIIDELREAGVQDFVFVIGHLGEKIRDYVEAKHPDIRKEFVYQNSRQGLGHAVWSARKELKKAKEIFIVLGDTIFDVDFKMMVEEKTSCLGVKKVEDPRKFGVAELNAEGMVCRVVEKPRIPKSNLALVGLYKCREVSELLDALDYIVQNEIKTLDEYQLTDGIMRMIEQGVPFKPCTVKNWFDCGRKDVLLETNAMLLRRSGFASQETPFYENTIVIHPVNIAPGCRITNSIIGPNVTIGEHARINYSIVKNSIIGSYASIEEVVLHHSVVGSDASIKGLSQSLNIGDNTEIDFS